MTLKIKLFTLLLLSSVSFIYFAQIAAQNADKKLINECIDKLSESHLTSVVELSVLTKDCHKKNFATLVSSHEVKTAARQITNIVTSQFISAMLMVTSAIIFLSCLYFLFLSSRVHKNHKESPCNTHLNHKK